MAEKYYPDFYLRKRERDSRYRRYSSLVIGCVLVAVVGGVLGYLGYVHILQPSRQQPQTAAELADEKRDLEQEQLLADGSSGANLTEAGDSHEMNQSGDSGIGDLSEIEYGASMAAVQVEVEGGSDGNGSAATGGDTTPADAESQTTAGSTEAPPEEAPTPPAEQERDEGFEPEADSVDGAPAGETGTPEAAAEAEQAPEHDSGSASGDAGEDAIDEEVGDGPVFRVYAGSFPSREDAEKAKDDLLALGFKGVIIDMELEHLLHVATLDSYEAAEAMQSKLVDSGFSNAFATLIRR